MQGLWRAGWAKDRREGEAYVQSDVCCRRDECEGEECVWLERVYSCVKSARGRVTHDNRAQSTVLHHLRAHYRIPQQGPKCGRHKPGMYRGEGGEGC